MPNRSDAIYWALAREHAQAVFARLEEKAEIAALSERETDAASLITRKSGSTAIIAIEGEIGKDTWISAVSGRIYYLGHDVIRLALEAALNDPLVDSILLSLDSPGGVVQGAKELADYIRLAASQKPMAAYANGLCASAAFWLAAATGKIYAPATALVGSVGVIMRLENWAGYYSKAGVQIEYIASGKYKAAGNDAREISEEERLYFQTQLAELHEIFREDVRKALSPSGDDSLWAEAQLMPAVRAAGLGLVTEIVTDEAEAIKKLSEKEKGMTLEELKSSQPELVKALAAETASAHEAALQAARADARKEALAIISAIGGEELAAKAETLLAANVTSAQIAALAPMLAKAEPAPQPSEAQARQAALEAITAATGGPLPAAQKPQKSALLADAERRAQAAGR